MSTSIACLEILTVLAESCDKSRLQRWCEIYNDIFRNICCSDSCNTLSYETVNVLFSLHWCCVYCT